MTVECPEPTTLRPLDELGILHGTDKSSLCHGYLDHYARAFEPFRMMPINVIEIGVMNGASTRTWRDYFPNATIVGIDIQERCRDYTADRIVIEIGSQADARFLSDVLKRYPPTIVIDDGSHLPEHQISSFELIYPSIRPGGAYVVEDLHINDAAAKKAVLTKGQEWPADYFAAYARQLMDGQIAATLDTPERRHIAHLTRRVEAFHGAVLMWRHPAYRFTKPHDPAWLMATVGATDLHYGWAHLGHFLLRSGGRNADVLHAFQRAVTLTPESRHYREALIAAARQCPDRALALRTLETVKSIVGAAAAPDIDRAMREIATPQAAR